MIKLSKDDELEEQKKFIMELVLSFYPGRRVLDVFVGGTSVNILYGVDPLLTQYQSCRDSTACVVMEYLYFFLFFKIKNKKK